MPRGNAIGVKERADLRPESLSPGQKTEHAGVSHLLRALSQDNHILCNSLAATFPPPDSKK